MKRWKNNRIRIYEHLKAERIIEYDNVYMEEKWLNMNITYLKGLQNNMIWNHVNSKGTKKINKINEYLTEQIIME